MILIDMTTTLPTLSREIAERAAHPPTELRPGIFVGHFVKDVGIVLEESKQMNLTMPGIALAHGLYQSVITLGHGRSGTHALMLALEQLSLVTVSRRQK